MGREGRVGLVADATATRSDDSLVAMEVDLGFELAPQFAVLRPLHVAIQKLYLLNS